MTQDLKVENINRWKKWELVADALEEDRHTTCEKLSRAKGRKNSRENAQDPTSIVRTWATHSPWQCSPAHRGYCNQKMSQIMSGKCYLMSPTSLPDFVLFPKLKEPKRGRRFSFLEERPADGTRDIRHMNKSGVLDGIIMLPKHWD